MTAERSCPDTPRPGVGRPVGNEARSQTRVATDGTAVQDGEQHGQLRQVGGGGGQRVVGEDGQAVPLSTVPSMKSSPKSG
ncbi:hypothetical protein ACM562_26345 [Streptomyces xantholiticus]